MSQTIELAHQHAINVNDAGNSIQLQTGGTTILSIEVTPNGPVLAFDAPQLSIKNSGALSLEAEEVSIVSRGKMIQKSADFEQIVSGDHQLQVEKDMVCSAQAIAMESRTGSMALKANDDLALNGLRILHNVPTEEELQKHQAKIKSFGDWLNAPASNPNNPKRLPWGSPKEETSWNS